jgi:hypothetical protein
MNTSVENAPLGPVKAADVDGTHCLTLHRQRGFIFELRVAVCGTANGFFGSEYRRRSAS